MTPLPSLSSTSKAMCTRRLRRSLIGPRMPLSSSSKLTLPSPSRSKKLKSVRSCWSSRSMFTSAMAFLNSSSDSVLLPSSSMMRKRRESPTMPRAPRWANSCRSWPTISSTVRALRPAGLTTSLSDWGRGAAIGVAAERASASEGGLRLDRTDPSALCAAAASRCVRRGACPRRAERSDTPPSKTHLFRPDRPGVPAPASADPRAPPRERRPRFPLRCQPRSCA